MATKVHMEALSPTMEEGQIVQWLKSEGDEVSSGEVIAEIETDKATMELSARGDGVLRKILVQEGGTAPVGALIGVIAAEDEDISDLVDGEEAAAEPTAEEPEAEGEEEEGEAAKAAGEEEEGKGEPAKAADEGEATPAAEEKEPGRERAAPAPEREEAPAAEKGDGRLRASPLARRLAREAGLALERIEGSGPGGRIVKRDIEAALEEAERVPAVPTAPLGIEPEEEYEDLPLSQMRKTIARRLVESIGPVPHFFLTVDVDMGRVLQVRRSMNDLLEAEDGGKVSVNDLILKAVAAALARHPECNAHWLGDGVRRFNRVHLGVAVAIDDGLITPVIRDAERKGLVRISQEVRELAGRAREKRLTPEEYTGATFSVSNLGMFGIEEFTAVINPPEAGILAVGQVEERPVVVDGELVVRPRMKMTMSCDHRVIDGAQGSRFLQTLRRVLEEPATALL